MVIRTTRVDCWSGTTLQTRLPLPRLGILTSLCLRVRLNMLLARTHTYNPLIVCFCAVIRHTHVWQYDTTRHLTRRPGILTYLKCGGVRAPCHRFSHKRQESTLSHISHICSPEFPSVVNLNKSVLPLVLLPLSACWLLPLPNLCMKENV